MVHQLKTFHIESGLVYEFSVLNEEKLSFSTIFTNFNVFIKLFFLVFQNYYQET